ncbi:uncharacterized protein LOC108098418 [Drosophila ficusphila]|uniref:uncharacterized protein LOC108098418 n=1 Tax=Drosophila ficusphila TaxID=30025 RepID=UPI0007E6C010|nr:uncharacterized protein LOC108098418 [Drosophila ficusphila]
MVILTFANDTPIVCRSKYPNASTENIQNHLVAVEKCLADWRIQVYEHKHNMFTLNRGTCPPLLLKNTPIPQVDEVTWYPPRQATYMEETRSSKEDLTKLKASSFHWRHRIDICQSYVVLFTLTFERLFDFFDFKEWIENKSNEFALNFVLKMKLVF